MEENMKVDKEFLKAFNLGYEVAKELDLKTPLFQNKNSDIILKSPVQAGMFQFIQDKQTIINNSKNDLKRNTIKKTLGNNKNKGNGLTP